MGKSLLQARGKKKAPRVSRSEAYLVNWKYMGDEPEADKIKTQVDLTRAYSWYGVMATRDEAREYLATYLKAGDPELAKQVARLPDNWVPMTAAWGCRIATRAGTQVTQRTLEMIREAVQKSTPVEVKERPKDGPSIQDRMRERLSDIVGDVEALVDSGEVNLYEWLQKNEVPAAYAPRIADYYRPVHDELVQAAAGKLDGYEGWTKPRLRARAEFYAKLVSDAERYAGQVKKARVPRKKKAVPADKLIKNLRYQRESNEHRLTSVNPQSLVGAQTIWTFNTKYSALSVFFADGPAGISVRGTTLVGFDGDRSKSMKIGRRTQERLDVVLKGGKLAVKRLVEEMTGEVNGRINENTVLVKVNK